MILTVAYTAWKWQFWWN